MLKTLVSILFLTSLSLPAIAIYEPAKTGQKDSYATNDDGQLQLGKSLPQQRFNDNQNGTLTDNQTGLMWLTDSFCANHFISGASSNSWQDAFFFVNALNNKTLVTSCKNYSDEYTDWRVPNINELQSLIPKGIKNSTSILSWLLNPGNNSPGFIDATLATYPVWSSTSVADNSEQSWTIDLNSGATLTSEKKSNSTLRFIFSAVREVNDTQVVSTGQTQTLLKYDDGFFHLGHKIQNPRFVSLNDGTVIDKLTGLNWLQDANCTLTNSGSWQSALNSVTPGILDPQFFSPCSAIYTKEEKDRDWRIPNIHELQSLIDFNHSNPALTEGYPFNIVSNKLFWSSTSSNGLMDTHAWAVSFQNGSVEPALAKTESAYAWPVRGPVNFPDLSFDTQDFQFESHYLNDESTQKTITFTNSGKGTLKIETLSLTNTNNATASSDFSIGQDGCTNRSLDYLSSCTTVIIFYPKKAGELQAKLTVTSNALGIEETNIIINGRGIGPAEESSNPNCFIATAVYGSYLEPEVMTLRTFRDEFLLASEPGKYLVESYYKYSPPIARIIQGNETMRFITRLILSPIIYAIKFPIILFLLLSLPIISIIKRYNRSK